MAHPDSCVMIKNKQQELCGDTLSVAPCPHAASKLAALAGALQGVPKVVSGRMRLPPSVPLFSHHAAPVRKVSDGRARGSALLPHGQKKRGERAAVARGRPRTEPKRPRDHDDEGGR